MKLFFKSLILLLFLNGTTILAAIDQHAQGLSLDVRMIGIWQGEYTEKDGALKSWIQTRNEDGSYRIEFRFIELDGTIHRLTEEGKWWIDKGLFYEITPSWMTQPDAYQYHFQDNGCIAFLLVESYKSAEDVGQYQFVECLSDSQPSI
ncbi:MAG: hypothetical protein KDF59_08690 [Nitrosomonas sp.]|nr:hypothetical protein [Nitrosomonas sp.]